ncbi:hypothetical protein HPB47_020117 [Ixodes persulcatus]|uniref:Uncharacterized protein n=1 Tax=Ixodes persulcatus TaxID=34615 RepID=A0AC60QJP8_IXOPE|nr:hypothetical protein HPB47_020117 [Ixodes persulcatus]
MGRPRALSGKGDRLRKERRRTQQHEWVCNRRKAAVASTSTASSSSDFLAKEHIARLESRHREQNQRCKGRRRANATDDESCHWRRSASARPGDDCTPRRLNSSRVRRRGSGGSSWRTRLASRLCDRLWFAGEVSTIGGMSDEKRESGVCALRQCIKYSSAGKPLDGEFIEALEFFPTLQVLYLTDLKVQPHFDKEKGVYSLTADKLPLIINPVEGSSGLHASVNPALNFMVYVVPRAHHPLYVYDERGQPLETNAFLSPKWGGFLFYNVPKFPESGAALPARVDLDMRSIFQVFLGQLRLLMGLPDTRLKEGLHVMDGSVCSDLEVDFLLRRRTQDYLSMSVSSLFSLSQLLSTISNIVIKDEIGDLIYSSVHSAERSLELLSKGDLETAFKEAEAAFLASEKAFFDPSLLALLYFPDDQK